MISNRSADWIDAWAVIEKRGNKLALFSGEIPIYWLRKVAQARVDEYGADYLYVEKVTIHRRFKKHRTLKDRA